jgi:hypothetical protein
MERVARYRANANEAIGSANKATDQGARAKFLFVAQGGRELADVTESDRC